MKITYYIETENMQSDGGISDSPESLSEIMHDMLDEFISSVLETNSESDCEISFRSGPSAFPERS